MGVLTRTGQAWKMRLMPLCVVVGSTLILLAAWFQSVLPGRYFISIILIGMFTNASAILFPALAITCPRCGSHWLWTTFRKPVGTWYRLMMDLTRCPSCGFPSHDTRGSVPL